MCKIETVNKKYHNNPYQAINFNRDEKGNLICPNGKIFYKHVRSNKYGKTEEIYECEACAGCPYKRECSPRSSKNRTKTQKKN